MTYKDLCAFFFLMTTFCAYAEWDFESENILQGVHRNYPNGASKLTNIKEVFGETKSGFRYKDEDFQMEAKVLVRSLQSPINTDRNDFAYADMTPPRRLFQLYELIESDTSENQTLIDTGALWASYYLGNWQLTAGRRPMGIGVLKVLPVWNRLYPIVPTLSGYQFVNNPDLLEARWNKDKWSFAAFSVFSEFYDESINALEFIHYGETLESHFLISKWWDQGTLGYSGVVDTQIGIYRMEMLAVADGGPMKSNGLQVGIGWEMAVSDKLSFLIEYYHSSFGSSEPDDYLLQDPTPFRTLLASDYAYPQMVYKLSDLLTNELGFLANLVDGSAMLVNDVVFSYSDNISIVGTIKKPMGGSRQEFGHLNIPVTGQIVEYVEWVSVALKMTI